MNTAVQAPRAHTTFELVRSQPIPSLNLVVEEYVHPRTGALHYHINADHDENVFLVALRTVPEDNTGVAHILEHTVLCGSEKYPVRDPFFLMIRRSLNTFMNAFTSSDWTAYPFASQNRKDFDNLLSVYLDSVFFSRLDPLDFAQEGHRLEFSDPENSESALEYKGVVYNEMKGAMSSVTSTLWHTLSRHLFPSTTYHFNSGGDPEYITDLSYEQLQSFYRTHYHPSNAIFMTFGDIPAQEHQRHFENRALYRFERLDETIAVRDEKRHMAPIRVEEYYALDEEPTSEGQTHIVFGWLLGHSTDLKQLLRAHLLSGVLLDNSASPLQRALEQTELGTAPSPLCGLEDSNRELIFVCGLEGSKREHADSVETLIMSTLRDVAENGVALEQVEAVLHQLELQQREIGGDGYPYGLQLILTAIGSATHRGDPVSVLNLEPVLEELHQNITDPNFIPGLARELLLENTHMVRLLMSPDTELSKRRKQMEASQLETIRAHLDAQQRQQIIDTARRLAERQEQQDDDSCLPKVGIEDVAGGPEELESTQLESLSVPATCYQSGTNGLVYQQLVVELPDLESELLELLSCYSGVLTEVGVGTRDYLQTQAWQSAVCGGISAYSSIRGDIENEQQTRAIFTLSSRALSRNAAPMSELLRESFEQPRFDELRRLRELISQKRARRDQSITGNGHVLAMSVACGGMSPSAAISELLTGMQSVESLRRLDRALQAENELTGFADKLRRLHEKISAAPRQLLLISDSASSDTAIDALRQQWPRSDKGSNSAFAALSLPPVREQRKQIWQTSTQVNFCATAFPTVPIEHQDAAALAVLGPFLRNGYLHRAIREKGGAYGGGASHDSGSAAFRFFSYRDPRNTGTLDDFKASVNWVCNTRHQWQPVEEAILGVVSSLDKPSSPAGEAKQHFHNRLFGRSVEQRRQFRQRVLEVRAADLKRVAETYLTADQASVAVITSPAEAEQLMAEERYAGYELCKLS